MNINNEIEVCDCIELHGDCIRCVKNIMLEDKVFQNLSELFKVFGDGTRLKIIYALLKTELCVCDIAEILGMTQSSISHQLRVLKSARLVKYRKEGKVVFYSLDDEHISKIFDAGMIHLNE